MKTKQTSAVEIDLWADVPLDASTQPEIYSSVHSTADRATLCRLALEVLGEGIQGFAGRLIARVNERTEVARGDERDRLAALARVLSLHLSELADFASRLYALRAVALQHSRLLQAWPSEDTP